MEPSFADPAAQTEPGPTGAGGGRPPTIIRRWWPVVALAVIAAMAVGATVGATIEHAIDQRSAARTLYRSQLLTTFWRIDQEEQHQLALPLAQRSAAVFDDVVQRINADTGVNGQGTLQVTMGAGSAAPPNQVAFAVTVGSPYASTTVAIWSILVTTPASSGTDDGVCVLSSSLLGPGRATTDLDIGGNGFIQVCQPSWWRGRITLGHPNLGMAGIDHLGD